MPELSRPATAAGRALLDAVPPEWLSPEHFFAVSGEFLTDQILAIEAEAAGALDVERLIWALKHMNHDGWPWDPGADNYWALYAAAIVAAYREAAPQRHTPT